MWANLQSCIPKARTYQRKEESQKNRRGNSWWWGEKICCYIREKGCHWSWWREPPKRQEEVLDWTLWIKRWLEIGSLGWSHQHAHSEPWYPCPAASWWLVILLHFDWFCFIIQNVMIIVKGGDTDVTTVWSFVVSTATIIEAMDESKLDAVWKTGTVWGAV